MAQPQSLTRMRRSEKPISLKLGPISAHDPLTYGTVTDSLIVTALAAILVPAVRVLRIDPARALRHE